MPMMRRELLHGVAGAALAVSAPFVRPCRAEAGTTIVHVGLGGSAADYLREAIVPPFTKETGINVQVIAGPDLAKVRAQVQSDRIEWDTFEADGAKAYAGQKEGLWEAVDYKLIDHSRFVIKTPPFAVPAILFSDGIAYDPARTKNPARSFAELFDAQKFPGRCACRDRANGNLEMALLADGVPASKMYPLDVERAFRVLDQIKPRVKKWASEAQLMVSMIQRNEADYTIASSNRVKLANDAGTSIDFSFGQCINASYWMCVVKNTRKKEPAMKWLEYVTRPNVQLQIANKLGLPSAVKGVDKMMDSSARRWVADLSAPQNLFLSDEYWADHYIKLDRRFKEWALT